MAAVYQANDTRQGNLVAIKEMSLSNVPANERSQAIQNFLAEARILSRLNHPNCQPLPIFSLRVLAIFWLWNILTGVP